MFACEIEFIDSCWLMKLNWRIHFGSYEIELKDLCWLMKLNWRIYVFKWWLICNWINRILLAPRNWIDNIMSWNVYYIIELTDSCWLIRIELTDICWLMKLNWRIRVGSYVIELTDLCWLIKLNWRYYVLKWWLICNGIDKILLAYLNWRYYVLKYCPVRKSAVLLRYALQLLWI
jgi:hypothetical protein